MNIACDMPFVLPLNRLAVHTQQGAILLPIRLRQLLEKFDASLAGSWSTDDAHTPRPVGKYIRSHSDVDILINKIPTSAESMTIIRSVLDLAWQHGVEVSKVSVRNRAEIDALWNPCRALTNKDVASQFMMFWSLIGAIELATSISSDTQRGSHDYALIKYFFKLCRNALLITGCSPANSYCELTTQVFSLLISHPVVFRAYAIKIGHDITLTSTDCEAMLSDLNWGKIMGELIDKNSCDLMADIRKDLQLWHRTGTPLNVESYITQLKTFEEFSELLPASAKAIRDYENRNSISAAA